MTDDNGLTLVEPRRTEGTVALRVDSLSKRYGATEAVDGVSFEVHPGEIFGLLGLNGAGKTTLISMLATERRPSGGDALLLGYSIRDERPAVRRMIHMTEYDDVEDTSLDLYAAVRNGFLQRRQKSISDAIRDRDRSWGIRTNRFDEQTESTFNDNQQIQDNSCCEIK